MTDAERRGNRLFVTLHRDWLQIACAKGYYAWLPLPLPAAAATQNLILVILTSELQDGFPAAAEGDLDYYFDTVAPLTRAMDRWWLTRKMGLIHNQRNQVLDHAVVGAARWFAENGGKLKRVSCAGDDDDMLRWWFCNFCACSGTNGDSKRVAATASHECDHARGLASDGGSGGMPGRFQSRRRSSSCYSLFTSAVIRLRRARPCLLVRPSKQIVAGVHDATTKFSKWRPAAFDAPTTQGNHAEAKECCGFSRRQKNHGHILETQGIGPA